MNGIRGKPSTSPPVQISAQQQILNSVPPPRGQTPPLYTLGGSQDVYQQSLYTQNQAPQYQQFQIGFPSQGYDVNKPSYAAPRMPSPGITNQPAPGMYQQQQTQGMRPTTPFYQGGQQQGIRQRYPGNVQNTQNQTMYPATGGNPLLFINSPQQFGTQPIMMGSVMPRMPSPQYNPTSMQQPNSVYQPIQQPPTMTQGFGNPPIFYNQTAQQQRPPSTGQPAPSQKSKERQKHVLKIVDPSTGKDIMQEYQTSEHSGGSSDSGSRSTPVSGAIVEPSMMSQSLTNEIAAEFAAKVAATLSPSGVGTTHIQQPHRPPSEPGSGQRMPPQHYPSSLETSQLNVMPPRMMDGGMVMSQEQQQGVRIAQPGMAPPTVPIAIPAANMHHAHQHRTQSNTPPNSVEPMHMNAPAVMDSEAMGLVIESIEQPPLNSELVVEPQGLSQGDMTHMHPIQAQTHYPPNVQSQIHPLPHQLNQESIHQLPPQASVNQALPQQGLVNQPPAHVSVSPQQMPVNQAQQQMLMNQPPPKMVAPSHQQMGASQPPQHILASQPPPQIPANQPPPQVTSNQPHKVMTNQPPPKVPANQPLPQVQANQLPPQVQANQPPPQVQANQPPQQQMQANQAPPQVQANQLPPQMQANQPPPVQTNPQPPSVQASQPIPQVQANQLPPQVQTNQLPQQMQANQPHQVPANQQPPPVQASQPPPQMVVNQPPPPVAVNQPPPSEVGKPTPVPSELMQTDKVPEVLQRPTETSVKKQPDQAMKKQSDPVLKKQTESVSKKQSEPVVQQSEPEKPIKVKERTPPPPISTDPSRSEPVSVSVEKVVSQSRTSSEISDSVKQDTPVIKREKTPELHILPPTPVEKEAKVDLQKTIPSSQSTEPVKEITVTEAPKKSKKKPKDYDKKAEQLAASSDFDAYIDRAPEPTPAPTENSVEVVEKENVDPANRLSPDRAVPPPAEEESMPSDEMVQKVEIKIEDSEELREEEDDQMDLKEMDEDNPELMLRYKYSEDQWSPINPEGKKHYDREFLLQFQLAPEAVVKPPGLPEIPDIILDKPHHGVSRAYSRESDSGAGQRDSSAYDFTPKYMWMPAGGGPKGGRPLPRQPSNQKNKDRGPPQRQINISISKDVELLHKAKDAWKPSHKDDEKKEKETDEETDAKTADLYKKTRSILNKLTPQKFQTLVSQMQALQIDSENKLKGVIDLVFEKAISEPNFSVAYANMCRCLSLFKVQSESKPGESVNFRAVLLTRCQREFEKDKSSEKEFTEKRLEIEKAEESKRDELKAELEYEESKAKRRSLGNIRFIGELFKLKMLTENIMHDCVFKLLRTKDPENLECLCRLLTTIGKELETDKAKPRMDQYFQQMAKIVGEKKTSSRVRFMLQDVIDLRKNKWIPRRGDNNPKTIDQIHQEVAKEAQDRAFQTQQALSQQKSAPKPGGGRRGGPQGGPMGPPGSDGWNMVGGQSRTPFKSIDRSIDPTKMKISKQQVDESSIQLGPGGGASRFAGWGRGSTGGGARASQEKERPSGPGNRFSALSKPEEEGRRGYSAVSPARGEGRGRGGFGRPPGLTVRLSQEQEREKAIAAAKSIGISQSAEVTPRDRSRGRELEKERPSPVPSVPALSKEEIDKKTKAILDEYLHIQDMKEAITCVKELPPLNHPHFAANALNHVLERSEVARRQTGHLLHDLVKTSIITVDSYIKGLLEVLEFAEDMEIDIPKIWSYLGELVGQMIQDGSVPLSFLKQAAEPLVPSNKAGIFVAEVLHDASHREGHKKVAELWGSSGLQWTDFLPKNQIEQFLIDKKLEFTKGGDSVPTTPTTGLPMVKIEEELDRLIVLEKKDNETVFDWIESNVDEPTTKRSKFIRALMTCVCNSAFIGDGSNIRVEEKEVSKRHDLLQKYLDHQAYSELQALYALQALVTKLEHPAGVLRQMFDTLYDEDIISEDAFIQWEKSDEEPEGKGVAMKNVVQFFTWLRETEEDNDS